MLRNKSYKLSMQDYSNIFDLFTIKDLQITSGVDVIRNEDVVLTILNALPNSYENFVQGVLAQETLPSFNQFMSRFLQEAQRGEL